MQAGGDHSPCQMGSLRNVRVGGEARLHDELAPSEPGEGAEKALA